jgi:asparagine synthase (glutamine-hydrolysing)
MCGIAGIVGVRTEAAGPAADRMLTALRHRGPDAEGVGSVADPAGSAPPVVLAHSRLAVIDLSPAGAQPMADRRPGGPAAHIVFNGEIYNYRELAADLARIGLVPRGGSDTEVLLLAYRAWSEQAVTRLRGMFAFAIADPVRRTVWFARDRLGIKPLYFYYPAGGGLLFASEVRALLAAGPGLVPPRICPRAIESFLAQGAVYGLGAHVAGVQSLGPGETLTVDWGGRPIGSRRYWALPFEPAGNPVPNRAEVVATLSGIARTAIRQHLVADVPIGVFLSGGIDSASVTTLATEAAASPVRTVSVGFDRPEFDETEVAAAFARELGTDHHTVRVSAETILADLDRGLASADQPTVDGFNTFVVSRAARQAGLTVALSGLGGDELFGGYASFRDVPRGPRVSRRLPRASAPALRWASRRIGSRGLLKLAEVARRPPALVHLYLLRRELFLPAERRELLPLPDESDPLTGLPPGTLDSPTDLDPENTVSALELTGYMRNMLLRDSDVFSMAHGLELRVPLLDHEFVEAAARAPGAWKRPGGVPKALLVDAVGPRLPRRAAALPKRGFTFPWADWFRRGLATAAGERLTDHGAWKRLGFDPRAPARLWDRFRRGDPAVGGLHILGLMVLADVASRQKLAA